MKKIILITSLCAIFFNVINSQNIVYGLKDIPCLSKSRTLATLSSVKGRLVLKKGFYVITYQNKGETFTLVPCNLPIIKTKKNSIKILFSGKLQEGNPAIKALGANIILTKLV